MSANQHGQPTPQASTTPQSQPAPQASTTPAPTRVHLFFRIIAPFAAAFASTMIVLGVQATDPPLLKASEPGGEISAVFSSLSLYLVGIAGVLVFGVATWSLYGREDRPWRAFIMQFINLVAAFLAAVAGILVIPGVAEHIAK
ncbi:hypothetical protein ACIQUC_15690 [Curtobacterium sp. NPDC098951]|uniref:hypothetical protein n=1 Tax=Curtobacterium sp. NPDC098951 TaxID=3363974 RepID=UPI0038100413